MTAFSGFAKEVFEFYAGLERDNTKAYCARHKKMYDDHVRDPMRDLPAELAPECYRAAVDADSTGTELAAIVRGALDEVRADWIARMPLNEWITTNVGVA